MANLMKAWAKADADGSGTLDKEELKVVLESMNRNEEESLKRAWRRGQGSAALLLCAAVRRLHATD